MRLSYYVYMPGTEYWYTTAVRTSAYTAVCYIKPLASIFRTLSATIVATRTRSVAAAGGLFQLYEYV